MSDSQLVKKRKVSNFEAKILLCNLNFLIALDSFYREILLYNGLYFLRASFVTNSLYCISYSRNTSYSSAKERKGKESKAQQRTNIQYRPINIPPNLVNNNIILY